MMPTGTDENRIIAAAFRAMHNGRSTDDVVINDTLNQDFIDECRKSGVTLSAFELNWKLLNLRKASLLGPVATRSTRQYHEPYLHAAEIAARHVEDKYQATIDQIMCDPVRRLEFDVIAKSVSGDVSEYCLRKAALKLRKGRRLQPELIKRVADWDTTILQFSAEELAEDPDKIPRNPGVYLFADATGYLYIGEAGTLRTRVAKHLDHSDRKALARYLWEQGIEGLMVELHVFDPTSNGRLKGHRKAYESDLIRHRRPRFNIQA